MGCCVHDTLNKLQSLQSRLERKGQVAEAARVGQLKTRIETTARRASQIQSKMTQAVDEHMKGAPDRVNKLYEECMKNPPATAKGREKEYCARTSWDIYNRHIK